MRWKNKTPDKLITEFVAFCRSRLFKPSVWARFEAGQLPFPYQMSEFFRPSVDTWCLAHGKWWHKQQSEIATGPQCPSVQPQNIKMYLSHPDFCWWPEEDHVDGTWSMVQLCHDPFGPAPVRQDLGTPSACFCKLCISCEGMKPKGWFPISLSVLSITLCKTAVWIWDVPFIFGTIYVESARVDACRSWPLARWDAASDLVQADKKSCCWAACGFTMDWYNYTSHGTWIKFVHSLR